MWKCDDCGARFERREKVICDTGTEYCCPECGIAETFETVPCEQCSDFKEKNFEKYCDSCKANVSTEITLAVLDIKTRWDAELVDQALARWVENNT